jgi:Tfp pilus assembly protein PilF
MNATRTTLLGLALAIFVGALWLHWPAVGGGFLTGMDDDEYLRQAERLKGLTWNAIQWVFTTTKPYYQPLPRLLHVLEYQIWGSDPRGHHATSVVLHALNAALVFGFLWSLLGTVASLTTDERLAAALSVALVFAIHPLQAESIAWMSVQVEMLCTAFGIGCLWAYTAGASRWVVWALFVAALLSQPMAVSLPFVMLAMDYFPLRRLEQVSLWRLLREKAVLLMLAVIAAVATVIFESHGGLMVSPENISLRQHGLLTMQSLAFYPWKLVLPIWLSPYYPLSWGLSLPLPLILASTLFVVGATILSVYYRRRVPALVAGWGAYVILVLPVSGLVQVGEQAVANRYAYLAMLPLLLVVAGAAVWLWRRCATTARLALAGLFVCELCGFGLSTHRQIPNWHSDETLWRATLVQFPNSGMAQYNLAAAFTKLGRVQEAIEHYEAALRINPNYAPAHNNLAAALANQGRVQEAIEHYEAALRINPNYAAAHHNLAVALAKLGRVQEAIEHYEATLRLDPNNAAAHNNLAVVLTQLGRKQEAIGHFEEALRIDPNGMDIRSNLTQVAGAP